MDEQNAQVAHKTYNYRLKPTPEQERAMAFVVRRCRERHNAAKNSARAGQALRGAVAVVASENRASAGL